MPLPRTPLFLCAAVLLGSARASLAAQTPAKVEITTTSTETVWYTDPVWIAIGAVVFLLVIVLLIGASRSGKTTTTIVR